MLAGAYLWTEYAAGLGWSWIENLGKVSLLVYWVHVTLVYGNLVNVFKRSLTVPLAALATVVVTGLMVALAEARLRWKVRHLERWKAATTVAGTAGA
jgi:uncharacterized protein YhhL (DUF1145 family)